MTMLSIRWRGLIVSMAVLVAACSASEEATDSASTTSGDPPPTTSAPAAPSVIQPQWVVGLSGPTDEDDVDGVAVGADDSLFVTGKFEQTVTLGGTELASAGLADIPMARFDRDGSPLWVERFGGQGEDNLFDVDADEAGAVAAGWFGGAISLGDTTLRSAGGQDCVIVAFDNDGDVDWAQRLGGQGDDGCNEVTVADDGAVVTSLDTEGGWESPAGAIPTNASRETLLIRLDRSGEIDWARRVGGDGGQRGKAIAIGPDGSIAFGGDTRGDLVIDGTVYEAPGGRTDAWLSHWSSDGDFDWATTWGGAGNDLAKGVTYGPDGVFAVGTFSGVIDIGSAVLDAGANDDLAVAAFAPDGTPRWATSVTAEAALSGVEATAAADGGLLFGSVVVAGMQFRSATGAATTLAGAQDHTGWLAHYRPDGSVGFAATIDGTTDARPGEIDRRGTRLYLDMTVKGTGNGAAGTLITAVGKDSSAWAIDLP